VELLAAEAEASRTGSALSLQDATRILREIKLLRMLKHADIVEIKHILLPPHPREFRDIYVRARAVDISSCLRELTCVRRPLWHPQVVFELLETDLHQVIKANDDLTQEHHQFFLYQMLRGLKFIHSGACPCAPARAVRKLTPARCSQRVPPRPEAEEHPGQQRLQAEDLRLWLGAPRVHRHTDYRLLDGLCGDALVPST
jgi:hypothetical protein